MKQFKESTIIPTMTREEQIKKAWELGFKNVVESLDTERTKEDVACMFFELGCRWADEDSPIDWQQVRIQAAIAAMQGFCANPNYFELNSGATIPEAAIVYSDDLIEKLKGE